MAAFTSSGISVPSPNCTGCAFNFCSKDVNEKSKPQKKRKAYIIELDDEDWTFKRTVLFCWWLEQILTAWDGTCFSLIKPGSHIPPTYLRRSRRLQLTTFGDLSQWVSGSSAMDRRHTQVYSKCKSNCAIFKYFTCKYGSNRLTGVRCVRRWCSHKIFLSPTTADNRRFAYEVEFSSTSQASRRSMPGIDYDSAIMFTYAVTVSQAVPAAMSQVWRRRMVLELLLFLLLNSGTVYLILSAHVTI